MGGGVGGWECEGEQSKGMQGGKVGREDGAKEGRWGESIVRAS